METDGRLDDRKVKILKAVIQNYLDTGEPVGSRTISKLTDLQLSSATIRNEMADLEELGYIVQPHTSAGRIPTDKGYRLYVDDLMAQKEEEISLREQQVGDKEKELDSMKDALSEKVDRVEELLQNVAKVLANNTNYATMITTPKVTGNKLRFVQLSQLEPNKLLAVIVMEGNLIRNKVITISEDISPENLLKLNLLLNTTLTGLTLQEMHLGLEVQDIKCDIAIMDIEYENRQFNGITLSKELNKKLPLCQIIYLTWVLEFAPEVYDTIHCYFVLKQNEEKMLPRAMEKAIQIYCDQEDHEIIELRNHGKMMYIRQADIIYAERQDRIVQIHTAQGTYQCYQSLTKIMKLLGRNFLRCHGGYVVNYNYIDTVMRESVILSNGTEIPIGRTYRTSFHEQYMRMVEQHV